MRSLPTDRTTFACFSPLVMIATFLFEIGAAIYVAWRYTFTAVSRIGILLLLLLATFQLAEYNVCEGSFGLQSVEWARVGFVAITFLPPLGIHLATVIAKKSTRYRYLLVAVYSAAVAFAITFLSETNGMQGGDRCMGNYVIFEVAPATSQLFAYYYYGLLAVGVGLSIFLARNATQKRVRYALYWLAAGYSAFIIPTTTVNIVDPSTIAGIPSIMCGFAVILALILVARVIPLTQQPKT